MRTANAERASASVIQAASVPAFLRRRKRESSRARIISATTDLEGLKIMRLTQCPYCGKMLDYKASVNAINTKSGRFECRRCGKFSAIKYKAACAKWAVIFALALIALNSAIFFNAAGKTILPNLVVTITAIIIYIALMPFHLKLSEIDGQREPEPKLKKNRHRKKKTKYKEVEFDEEPLKGTSFDE